MTLAEMDGLGPNVLPIVEATDRLSPRHLDGLVTFFQSAVDRVNELNQLGQETGYLVLTVRSTWLVFRELEELGHVVGVDWSVVMSSRALAGSMDFLFGRPVTTVLVDDTMRRGNALRRLVSRIETRRKQYAASTQSRASDDGFRLELRSYASAVEDGGYGVCEPLIKDHISSIPALAVDGAEFDELANDLFRFLSASPKPGYVDYPIATSRPMRRSDYYNLLRRQTWATTSVTNAICSSAGHERLSFSPLQGEAMSACEAALGDLSQHIQTVEVRTYAVFNNDNVVVKVVPIVHLQPLRVRQLDEVLSSLGGDLLDIDQLGISASRAKLRLAQFFASWRVLPAFLEGLPGDVRHLIPQSLDAHEVSLHLPPGARTRVATKADSYQRPPLNRPELRSKPEPLTPARSQVLWELVSQGMTKPDFPTDLSIWRKTRSFTRQVLQGFELVDWDETGSRVRQLFDVPIESSVGLTFDQLCEPFGNEGDGSVNAAINAAVDVYNDVGGIVPATLISPVAGEPAWAKGEDFDQDADGLPLDYLVFTGYRTGEGLAAVLPERSVLRRIQEFTENNHLAVEMAALVGLYDPMVDETSGYPAQELSNVDGWPGPSSPLRVMQSLAHIYEKSDEPILRGLAQTLAGNRRTLGDAELDRTFTILDELGKLVDAPETVRVRALSRAIEPTGGGAQELEFSSSSVQRRADSLSYLYWQVHTLQLSQVGRAVDGSPSLRLSGEYGWSVPEELEFHPIEHLATAWDMTVADFRQEFLGRDGPLVSVASKEGNEFLPSLQFDPDIGESVREVLGLFRGKLSVWEGLRWLTSESALLAGIPVTKLRDDEDRVRNVAREVVARRCS